MIKIIYILWFQGFNNAPYVVKKCVESWKYYNKDWKIILLDRTNIDKYIKIEKYIDLSKKKLLLAHESDIIRLCLLKKYGGLWVDSTVFCNKPLDDWFEDNCKYGFFAFDRPWPNLIINTWFIYSDKKSYIITTWLESTIRYYTPRQQAHTYHIYTHLFENLTKYDYQFKKIWNTIPKISGIPCRYIQEKGLFNTIDFEYKNIINNKQIPVYKLTYKDIDPNTNFDNTSLNLPYLFSTLSTSDKL
jgi:hypothetical protein